MQLLFSYLRRYWPLLALALVLAAVNQVFSLLDPYIFRKLVDHFAGKYPSVAGLRAVPLGQTDGQKIIARLGPVVARVVDSVEGLPLEALGGAAFRADIASMKHETQYTRLFRS